MELDRKIVFGIIDFQEFLAFQEEGITDSIYVN